MCQILTTASTSVVDLGTNIGAYVSNASSYLNPCWTVAQRVIKVVEDVALHVLHALSNWSKNVDWVGASAKLADSCLYCWRWATNNDPFFDRLGVTIKNITSFIGARGIFGRLNGLLYGEKNKETGRWETDAQKDVPEGEINFNRLVGGITQSIGDTLSTGNWLAEMNLLGDPNLFNRPIALPYFGAVCPFLTLNTLQKVCTVVGSFFSLAALAAGIGQKGWYPNAQTLVKNILSITGDNCKIIGTGLTFINRYVYQHRYIESLASLAQGLGSGAVFAKNFIP